MHFKQPFATISFRKFLVLVYIPRPDFSTRLGIKQHINWPKNTTLQSSTELVILLQKLPAQRQNQLRNRIDPLVLKKKQTLHNQLNFTSWHLFVYKTRTARLPASVTHIVLSTERVCQVLWYQKGESTELPNLYLWACPLCVHLYTPSR